MKSLPWVRINETRSAKPTLASQAPNVKIINVRNKFLFSPIRDEIIRA